MQENDRGGAEFQYHNALREGRFVIQHCDGCGLHVFFPRVVCPHCAGTSLRWVEPSGTGVVYSTTTVRQRAEKGGDYDVSLIDLDEGVRMMSRVEGLPPGEVRIGMRVRARIIEEEGTALVVFVAEEQQ